MTMRMTDQLSLVIPFKMSCIREVGSFSADQYRTENRQIRNGRHFSTLKKRLDEGVGYEFPPRTR